MPSYVPHRCQAARRPATAQLDTSLNAWTLSALLTPHTCSLAEAAGAGSALCAAHCACRASRRRHGQRLGCGRDMCRACPDHADSASQDAPVCTEAACERATAPALLGVGAACDDVVTSAAGVQQPASSAGTLARLCLPQRCFAVQAACKRRKRTRCRPARAACRRRARARTRGTRRRSRCSAARARNGTPYPTWTISSAASTSAPRARAPGPALCLSCRTGGVGP